MKKIAFLFPGVGSQYVGMGKTLYDNFKIFRDTLTEAGDILKTDLPALCFLPGNKEELDRLENAQSVLLTFSIAAHRVFQQEIGIQPDFCLGHSLGEYSALCSAGIIKFSDALRLVRQRGLIVNDVSSGINGTMAWVINLDINIVENVCRESFKEGREIYVSAYDSPTQASISGHTEVLMKVAKKLEKEGAIVYPLQLSGPFHCRLMKEAAEKMRAVLRQYDYNKSSCAVIANHNARPYKDIKSISDNLSLQLISPIRWQASIEYLLGQGVGTAVEMGPKNVLKFLVAKNTGAIRVYTTDNNRDLELISSELLVGQEEYLHLIGKCLGAAVSTRNRSSDIEEFAQKVVKPYREVESCYKEWAANGGLPGKEEVKKALQMLHSVMTAKKVPQQEQEYWFERVLENKIVSTPGEFYKYTK